MASEFSRTLSLLRRERGVSQRTAAQDLGISQALLSHYENGIREPGLAFVVKVCGYYHVSADYLLGRTLSRDGAMIEASELYDAADSLKTMYCIRRIPSHPEYEAESSCHSHNRLVPVG